MLAGTAAIASLLIAAISLSGAAVAADPVAAREGQWVYRDRLGDGTPRATAAFLSWDYATVIFTATCDQRAKQLVIRHSFDIGRQRDADAQIVLRSRKSSVPFTTKRQANVLEGRAKLTPALYALLMESSDLAIDLPNEMDEPYYLGAAKVLRKVALACA